MGSNQNDGTSLPPSEPKLCANGCGFFGTAANMNLCSKCYRDLRAEEEQAASAKAAVEKTLSYKSKTHIVIQPNEVKPVEPVVSESSSALPPPSESSSAAEQPGETKVASRCLSCRKKVGLTGFKCRCGSTFCSTHRYPEKHECEFDYKGDGRAMIANNNPLIKADKLERI